MKESTRLKFGLIVIGVIMVEAVLKALMVNFPFDMAVSIQSGIYGAFAVAKTTTDLRALKVETTNGAVQP